MTIKKKRKYVKWFMANLYMYTMFAGFYSFLLFCSSLPLFPSVLQICSNTWSIFIKHKKQLPCFMCYKYINKLKKKITQHIFCCASSTTSEFFVWKCHISCPVHVENTNCPNVSSLNFPDICTQNVRIPKECAEHLDKCEYACIFCA